MGQFGKQIVKFTGQVLHQPLRFPNALQQQKEFFVFGEHSQPGDMRLGLGQLMLLLRSFNFGVVIKDNAVKYLPQKLIFVVVMVIKYRP